MPFVPIANTASLDVIWTQEDQTVENTFHYRFGGAVTEADLAGICDTYASWAGASANLFTDVCALVKMEARDLGSEDGLRTTRNVIPAVDGTNTSGHMPNNVTFALKRQTGLAGRKNRGRIYLIGLPSGNISADRQSISGSVAASYVGFYDTLMNSQFSDNGADEVIAHKALGTATHVTGYAFSDLFLDSQRRRLPGHNRHH